MHYTEKRQINENRIKTLDKMQRTKLSSARHYSEQWPVPSPTKIRLQPYFSG